MKKLRNSLEKKVNNCTDVNTDVIDDIVLAFTNVVDDVASDMFSQKVIPKNLCICR